MGQCWKVTINDDGHYRWELNETLCNSAQMADLLSINSGQAILYTHKLITSGKKDLSCFSYVRNPVFSHF